MPIYEYRCCSCKGCFEKLILRQNQSVSCPECHSEDAERIMSSFGIKAGSRTGPSDRQTAAASSSCASCTSRNCSQCR